VPMLFPFEVHVRHMVIKDLCQDLQAEHMNMRIIDCIDNSYLMEGGDQPIDL
jgi:hypothetical protein